MRRAIFSVTTAVATVGLLALGASAASAADLPEDNDLFVLDSAIFYSSTSTGALTAINTFPDDGGKYGADYDPTSGLGYYFEDGNPCTLYSLDITTGESTLVGPVGGAGDHDECDALDVAADGTLRIADQDGTVLTVDKATGATLSSVVSDIPNLSFITQASDGTFYAGSYSGGLYVFDPATGAGAPIDSPLDYYETASIDANGTLWISSGGDQCGQGIWSLDITDPLNTLTFQGDMLDGTDCVSGYALFVAGPAPAPAPAPQLAVTGTSSVLALGGFALVLVVGGALALAARRTQRA